MLDVVWDMETGDPDDLFTLCLLIAHPKVNLKAVTVTPGAPDQIGLVRQVLQWLAVNIPIGAYNIEHPKKIVSDWYYEVYGDFQPSTDALVGWQVLAEYCDEQTTLITGAPLKNLGRVVRKSLAQEITPFRLGRWVAQGGFAGEGVVPSEKQLEKFKGRVTCPTFNLNGDSKATLRALSYPHIGIRRFVSKNVCHRVYYDAEMHILFEQLMQVHPAYGLIWQGMDAYLKSYPEGKKFHDPLAACCAIDESIGQWVEVELFREKGEWGARLAESSGTWIIIDYDHQKFIDVLTETAI